MGLQNGRVPVISLCFFIGMHEAIHYQPFQSISRGDQIPGVLPEKLGGSVRPASQNPYPIYDQDLQYSLPYLWPNQKSETLFKTLPLDQNPVQTNVKLP